MTPTARAFILVGLGAFGTSACGSQATSAASAPPAGQRVVPPPASPAPQPAGPVVKFTPPPPAYAGPLPPIPQVSYPLPRSRDIVQAVYTFAARHPEVLHYVPCFCGCQRSGHQGNDDCFVKARDAAGRPEWDAHGMG